MSARARRAVATPPLSPSPPSFLTPKKSFSWYAHTPTPAHTAARCQGRSATRSRSSRERVPAGGGRRAGLAASAAAAPPAAVAARR